MPDSGRIASTDAVAPAASRALEKDQLLAASLDDVALAAVCAAQGVTLTLGAIVGSGSFGVVRCCTYNGARAAAKASARRCGRRGRTCVAPPLTRPAPVRCPPQFLFLNEAQSAVGRPQEWSFLLALRHPAVLPCFCAFQAPSPAHTRQVVCMITPLCDADLGAAIAARWANTAFSNGISASERLDLATQLCAGLAYLHERHVAHRDIKPGNILLSGRSVQIADLGLSKEVDPRVASAHHTAAGTEVYAVRSAASGAVSDSVCASCVC
jgi:serine/threonine protein kinase